MRGWRIVAVLALALVVGASGSAWADAFDFTTLNGGVEGQLANSVTVNGVTAEGFGPLDTTAPLWLRNVSNDHGLGVCSEGNANCVAGAGDVNEISQLSNREGIRLTRPDGSTWTSLVVSSLDNGGSNGAEKGLLYWSNDAAYTPPLLPNSDPHFGFGFGTVAGTINVEGDILTLAAASGFDPTAKYLWFVNDDSNCEGGTCNNDYLVWKGTISTVPEPTTLALVGTVLVGLMIGVRRRTRLA